MYYLKNDVILLLSIIVQYVECIKCICIAWNEWNKVFVTYVLHSWNAHDWSSTVRMILRALLLYILETFGII